MQDSDKPTVEDYIRSSRYLKWNETDRHDICLNIEYQEYLNIRPVISDAYGQDQYEIPVICCDDINNPYDSIIATRSKYLLGEIATKLRDNHYNVLRLKKQGSGFNTKWIVQNTPMNYNPETGKFTKQKGS